VGKDVWEVEAGSRKLGHVLEAFNTIFNNVILKELEAILFDKFKGITPCKTQYRKTFEGS
jgi:hypothetical protein